MNDLKESRRSFFAKGLGLAGAGFLSTFGQGLEAAVERTPSASNPSDLKITDMQAACGLAQLGKLEYFIEKRRSNYSL